MATIKVAILLQPLLMELSMEQSSPKTLGGILLVQVRKNFQVMCAKPLISSSKMLEPYSQRTIHVKDSRGQILG